MEPSKPPNANTPIKRGSRPLFIGMGVFLGLLGLLLWALNRPRVGQDPFVVINDVGPLFVDAGDGLFTTATNKLDSFNQQSFAMPKPADTTRIFALGGSTTFGKPHDHRVAFPTWLQQLLQAGGAHGVVEVINAGGLSYASYRLPILMDELVRYNPDLFVIYTGHHEFLEARTYAGAIHQPEWLRAIEGELYPLHRIGLIQQWLLPQPEAVQLSNQVKTKLDNPTDLSQFQRTDPQAAATLRHFKFNVLRMLAVAKAHDVPVVMVSPAANYKDFPPFKSQASAALSAEERLRLEAGVAAARTFLKHEDAESARKAAQGAVAVDSRYAAAHFYLGRAKLQLADFPGAAQAFQRALEEDIFPLRAPYAIHRHLVEISQATGVSLLDYPAILRREAEAQEGVPLLGDHLFVDHIHPTIAMQQLLAEELVPLMSEVPALRDAALPSVAERERLYAMALADTDVDLAVQRDAHLAKVLGWAGRDQAAYATLMRTADERQDNPQFHHQRGILLARLGRPGEALASYRQAQAMAPDQAEIHFDMGRLYLTLGELVQAENAFNEARALDGTNAKILLNVGLVHLAKGEHGPAVVALEQAAGLNPDLPMVHDRLGLARLRNGDLDGAESAIAEQLRRTPDDAGVHFDMGLVHAQAGRFTRAEAAFTRAVQLQPDYAEAHRNLALVYRRLQRSSDEEQALLTVAKLQPKDVTTALDLGVFYHQDLQFSKAEKWYRKALDLDPDSADAYTNLGALLAAQGQVADAMTALRTALEIDPLAGDAHFNLARLYLSEDRPDEAAVHLRLARELGMHVPPAMFEQAGIEP